MLVQIVRFKSGLPEDELMKVAMDRVYAYRAVLGLLEKYYTRTGDPDCYAGIMIWDSPEALAAFRQTELAATIGEVYGVINGPKVEVFRRSSSSGQTRRPNPSPSPETRSPNEKRPGISGAFFSAVR